MTCASARVIPGWVKVGRTSLGTGDLGARVSARNSSRNIFLEWRTPSALRPRSTSSNISPGGGRRKSTSSWANDRSGCHAQIFFGGARLLIIFSKSKISNAGRVRRPGRLRVRSMACCGRPPGIGNTAALARRIFFRRAGSPGGAISKFSPIAWTTAWQAHAFFREIPETFFCQ